MRLAFAGEVFAADAVGQIFDVFSQIQYNGGMLRQGQCLYGTGSAYRDDTGYFFAVLMTCLMRNCEESLCIQ